MDLNKNMDCLRNYVSGHFEPKIRIPDIIYLLEGLAFIRANQIEQNSTYMLYVFLNSFLLKPLNLGFWLNKEGVREPYWV
jgi:hypothetical protein